MARKKVDEVDDLDLEDFEEDFDEEEEKEAAPKRKRKAKAKKEEKPKGLGAREMAEYLEVEPKTFRAWLRRKIEEDEISFDERDPKQRYDFGDDFDSPQAQAVINLYHEDVAARERRKEEREAERLAKAEAEAENEAPKKKAPAKKKAAAKKKA